MTKQEQIEEINKIIRRIFCSPVAYKMTISYGRNFDEYSPVYTSDIAEALYNAGYRKGEVTSYTATINSMYIDQITQLGYRMGEIRKETAKEILDKVLDIVIDEQIFEIAKQYGVEVEE